MANRLFIQLTLLLSVSVLLGILFAKLGINIYLGFILGIIVQYGLYNGYVYFLDAYVELKNKKLENERIKELSYQVTEVTCPCLRRIKEIVPVRLNTANYYKCGTCNKQVNVFVATETALVTEPISDTDISSLENIIKEKLSAVSSTIEEDGVTGEH